MAGAAAPRPATDEVDLWWIDLDGMRDDAAGILTGDELRRAARLRRARDRARWTAARAALRQILAGYTGTTPRALRISHGVWGKPRLEDDASLHFSLTHAANRAALAVARQREVGIDLEPIAAALDLPALLAAACTPAEAAWIRGLAEERRGEGFLTLWTLKEAYLKATGAGLTREPRSISVTLSPPQGAVVHDPFAAPGAGARAWSVRVLDAGAGWVAALAVAGRDPMVRVFAWPAARDPAFSS